MTLNMISKILTVSFIVFLISCSLPTAETTTENDSDIDSTSTGSQDSIEVIDTITDTIIDTVFLETRVLYSVKVPEYGDNRIIHEYDSVNNRLNFQLVNHPLNSFEDTTYYSGYYQFDSDNQFDYQLGDGGLPFSEYTYHLENGSKRFVIINDFGDTTQVTEFNETGFPTYCFFAEVDYRTYEKTGTTYSHQFTYTFNSNNIPTEQHIEGDLYDTTITLLRELNESSVFPENCYEFMFPWEGWDPQINNLPSSFENVTFFDNGRWARRYDGNGNVTAYGSPIGSLGFGDDIWNSQNPRSYYTAVINQSTGEVKYTAIYDPDFE